jgi:gamma-glutamyltranspeptidase/glutathione hydrolase
MEIMPPTRSATPLHNWPPGWRFPRAADPIAASRGMVVSTDRYATDAGAEVLRAGGNAVDATVAVFFALAVVNPEAGNIGGGSFLVLRTAEGETITQDSRSCAPRAATADMFLDAHGDVTEHAVVGHLSVAVPGSVRGIWDLHRRFGKKPWQGLLEPAVQLARGFVVRERFLHSFTPWVVETLARFPTSARVFLPGGRPPRVGDVFRQPELAATLERIRSRGPDDFYLGETAALLVVEVERGGGILTHEDLASYESLWREPVRFTYREHTVFSMPPSSSGGVTLAEASNVLARFRLADLPWHGAEHVHILAEAWRRAYADRNHYLADPAFVEMPLDTLMSPAYASWRAREISRERASASETVGPGVEAFLAGASHAEDPDSAAVRAPSEQREGPHTTHFSIVDEEGAAVSVTTTINSWYGSKATVAGAGFVLNNDLDDFTAKPGSPNQFGLVQGEANRIEPGKRMLSAMSPSIVSSPAGSLAMVVGTPGGSSIITTVCQVISNVLDHRMTLTEAVHAPRVHHQHLPDQIFYEPDGLPGNVRDGLEVMGHKVVERDELSGDVQAILIHPDGTLEGRSDPRRGGAAAGY